jgi:hypothetical protein
MHSLLQKSQAWRSGRELRSLQRWEQERAKGKARFVFRTALTYSLTIVGATHAYESFFYGAQDPISLISLVVHLFVGFAAGTLGWSAMEDKYRAALNNALARASLGSKLPPHNKPGA